MEGGLRRNSALLLLDPSVGDRKQQELIQVVRILEGNRTRFSTAVLGYLRGAAQLLASPSESIWNDWHRQIDYFISQPKMRSESEDFLAGSEALFSQGVLAHSSASKWLFRDGEIELTTDAEGLPIIVCREGTLVCHSKGDSSKVHHASGRFHPLKKRFYGSAAILDWERIAQQWSIHS